MRLKRAADGEAVDAASVVPATGRVLVPFLTQFADFDSWELAQKLVDDLPRLEEAGVAVVAVGIGSAASARAFCDKTNFPMDKLYADETGEAYAALRFAPGFGREGGALGWLESAAPFVNGYAKLLVMCAGIGSPGTLAAVFGGYLGNKNADPIFKEGSNYDNAFIRGAMDATLGSGYQRPFELATLRLTNMTAILNEWDALAPADDAMLVQRGGSFVFEDGVERFRHDDAGILGYCPVGSGETALSADRGAARPGADDSKRREGPLGVRERRTRPSPRSRSASRRGRGEGERADLNGVAFGVHERHENVKANLNKAGFGVVPPCAIQSFDVQNERIRNGIYLGPIEFFFDGPFLWRENLGMLEFTFTKVSLKLGPLGPWSVDIDDGKWEGVKGAEQAASAGGGRIEKADAKATKPGANPFFKFVFADDRCIAARGRGGGLALWAREGDPETDASA